MRLREGFYSALEAVVVAGAHLESELDRRGISDPRQRTLAFDVCQAAAQAQSVREGRTTPAAYVAFDHRLRRHIAAHLDADSVDARALTRKADSFLAWAVGAQAPQAPTRRRSPVVTRIPRLAARSTIDETTFTGTAA